jgi:hypothetical protein
MTRSLWTTLGSFVFSVTFATSLFAQNVPERPNPSLDLVNLARQAYIFQLAPNTSPAELQRIAREVASIGGGRPMHVYTTVMRGFSAQVPDAGLARIRDEFPQILRIYRSNIFSISGKARATPGGGGSVVSTSGGEIIPWGVARVLPKEGNKPIIQDATDGPNTLWVLDTGVDLDNADLNVDTARSVNCVSASGFRGKDTADDEHGHGTHVAGTAAAISGNNIDVVGVAAGATVASVRVLDRRGSGTTAEVICGLDYVAARGRSGDVVNMSLGGPADLVLDEAVLRTADLGILFSLAAGNERTDSITRSPARVRHANVYTVSAIDSKNAFASFSNYGNPPIDRAAPGVQVLSLKRGGGTATKSGTSMAAPHVAGLLILGKVGCDGTAVGDPDSKPDAIAYLLGSSCPSPDGLGM